MWDERLLELPTYERTSRHRRPCRDRNRAELRRPNTSGDLALAARYRRVRRRGMGRSVRFGRLAQSQPLVAHRSGKGGGHDW